MGTIISREISEIAPEAYLPFSAYVIQTRALPDARDCLKTGGRYILWSQYFNKNTFDKNRKKAADVVGTTMHWNPHGDAGIYGNLVRFAKPFAMRYRLEDPKGNVGTMTKGDDHTASRYLEIRSSEIASEFTRLLKKNTIDDWKLNYTQEDKYPAVFPTLFPNFVNGNTGIGVGCVSSIPTYNLTEAIASLKKLVENPNADYDEIYIAPDFPTGATIINANEVKESLKTGRGAAVKLRANLEYNSDTNTIIVTQIPYQVFTERITGELDKAIEEERIGGIKSYYDGTDRSCGLYGTQINIELNKGANVKKVCQQLFKETSLQSSFTICQLMLENGVTPKQYGLKEMMLAYLDHAMNCLKKSYIYDYDKLQKSILINEGFMTALAHIDEIIDTIKNSDNENIVINAFKEKYGLVEEQSKAILNLKLQRLMRLEAIKIEKELNQQKAEAEKLNILINNKEEFNKSFIAELDRIDKKYGDTRRTQVMNLDFKGEDEEPIEKKELLIHYTNLGNIYTTESSTLLRARRGTKGTKVKLADNEVIVKTLRDDNFSSVLAFTNTGRMHHIAADSLPINSKININQLFNFEIGEVPTTITTIKRRDQMKYFVFVTKEGMIKKTESKEYDTKRKVPIKAINLKDGDKVVNVFFIDNEKVGILTFNGNYVIINTEDITPIGRTSMGVRGIKLSEGDYVIDAKPISNFDKTLVVLSENGLIKKTSLDEFPICTRGTKGKKISGVRPGDRVMKHLTFDVDCDIIIIVKRKAIKISSNEISNLSRAATGVKAISLNDGDKAIDLIKESIE